jgi:hypothetical protein
VALTCSCCSSVVAQQVSLWENEIIDHRARSPDRRGGVMSAPEAARAYVDESVESMEWPNGTNGFHLEPRCRICRNDQVRTKVQRSVAADGDRRRSSLTGAASGKPQICDLDAHAVRSPARRPSSAASAARDSHRRPSRLSTSKSRSCSLMSCIRWTSRRRSG